MRDKSTDNLTTTFIQGTTFNLRLRTYSLSHNSQLTTITKSINTIFRTKSNITWTLISISQLLLTTTVMITLHLQSSQLTIKTTITYHRHPQTSRVCPNKTTKPLLNSTKITTIVLNSKWLTTTQFQRWECRMTAWSYSQPRRTMTTNLSPKAQL